MKFLRRNNGSMMADVRVKHTLSIHDVETVILLSLYEEKKGERLTKTAIVDAIDATLYFSGRNALAYGLENSYFGKEEEAAREWARAEIQRLWPEAGADDRHWK